MTNPPPAQLLAALQKLPGTRTVSYRGLTPAAAAPTGTIVTQGLIATSRDPRIATENFTTTQLLAVAGRRGRDIAQLAQNPAEAEIVFLPGSILKPVTTVRLDGGLLVHVAEELLTDGDGGQDPEGLPPTVDALVEHVIDEVAAAEHRPDLVITSPGKFAGALS